MASVKTLKPWFNPFYICAANVLLASFANAIGSCSPDLVPRIAGIEVLSTTASELSGITVATNNGNVESDLCVCEVNITLSHPGEHDRVLVQIWLPSENWNGRFQATGGGGFSTGFSNSLKKAASLGYSSAQTDGGHVEDQLSPSTWALDTQGEINWSLLSNFASRSLHDMAVVGKAVTESFYGQPPHHSYWNGCSTGGRQGYMEAQEYPEDFDGIMAVAPAINWHKFLPAEQWGQVVMAQEGVFPSKCEYQAFLNAIVATCDELDGLKDGVIGDPFSCKFDPFSLVGNSVECDGRTHVISEGVAKVVANLNEGPKTADGRRLWYGLSYGTDYTGDFLGLGRSKIVNGSRVGVPFPIADNWIRYFLKKDPDFDTSTITYSDYESLFSQSVSVYQDIIGTDNPDLTAFYNRGGKLLTWHGLADNLIFPNGTLDYYHRAETAMGGKSTLDKFYRLFLAPGVGHCEGGNGPVPVDSLDALVDWVEKGEAPSTLFARTTNDEGETITRNICAYPLVSRYDGHGDPNSAESFSCAPSYQSYASHEIDREL